VIIEFSKPQLHCFDHWNKALLLVSLDNGTIYKELVQQQIKAPIQEAKSTGGKNMQRDGCSRQHY
jgi:hypothetical protein